MSSPAPNAQRLAPLLPRLLWRELHLLAPLWIALYALGAILLIGFFLTLQPSIYISSSNITGTIFGVTGFSSGIFLVTSLLVTFAAERESDEDKFSFHRGFSPSPIYAVKIALPLVMLLAMVAALITTGYLATNLRTGASFTDATIQDYETPSPGLVATLFWLTSLTIITAAWTILFSLSTRKVIHALLLTLAALIANYIYCIFIDQLLVSSPLRTPATFSLSHALTFCILALLPLMTTIAVLHYHPQLLELLSHLHLTRTPRTPKPIPLTTNPPPLEISTWKHLGWLHLREQYPLLIAASVVTITAVIQPMLSTYPIHETFFGNLEKYPFYIASILFLLFSGTLTFSPEHTHSNYRFWSDRGLSPTLIFRSRILRYSLILLTTLGISVILFTTTDAILHRNNSLLFAFDSGQLFHLDDTTKTAPLFIAQYLLTAIPVGIFWSWICRQLIMSIVMTAFSMLFCFAYGNWASISNNWPYLVTHAPFLIATIACIWTLFPERFQLQPRTRIWLLPTLAAPLALFISIGDILIYRVLEVPPISASLAGNEQLLSSEALSPSNEVFSDRLKSILQQIDPLPKPLNLINVTRSLSNGSPFTRTYLRDGQIIDHDFEVECFGWDSLHPELQVWTQKHLSIAVDLKDLLSNTPISEMRVSISNSLDSRFHLEPLPLLLIYAAKWNEHNGDLPAALSNYTAADRFAEFLTLFNAGLIRERLDLRARIVRNLASYYSHPDSDHSTLSPFLRYSIKQLPDTPNPSTQRLRTFYQLTAFYEQWEQENKAERLLHPLAYSPTEKWRYHRAVALWTDSLHNRNSRLLQIQNFPRYSYLTAMYNAYEIQEIEKHQERIERQLVATPLISTLQNIFDLQPAYLTQRFDYEALVNLTSAQARLLIIIAERNLHQPVTSISQVQQYYQQAIDAGKPDEGILNFLEFNHIEITSNHLATQKVPANTKRIIQSSFLGEETDLALPLPDFVPLTLANKEN